jgi:hypothetical protein
MGKAKAGTALETLYEVDSNGCWLWLGAISKNGYGSVNGMSAHRMMYILKVGPVPEGLDLDHLCRVRRCVNPEHLDPVTRKENLNRGLGTKYSNEKKAEVVKVFQDTGYSTRRLAALFGISKSQIHAILKEMSV